MGGENPPSRMAASRTPGRTSMGLSMGVVGSATRSSSIDSLLSFTRIRTNDSAVCTCSTSSPARRSRASTSRGISASSSRGRNARSRSRVVRCPRWKPMSAPAPNNVHTGCIPASASRIRSCSGVSLLATVIGSNRGTTSRMNACVPTNARCATRADVSRPCLRSRSHRRVWPGASPSRANKLADHHRGLRGVHGARIV